MSCCQYLACQGTTEIGHSGPSCSLVECLTQSLIRTPCPLTIWATWTEPHISICITSKQSRNIPIQVPPTSPYVEFCQLWTPPAFEVYRSCSLLLLNYDADFRISGALGCGALGLGIGFRAHGMGPRRACGE